MHSFFPVTVYSVCASIRVVREMFHIDRYHLIKNNIRFSREKKELINELELLIIDE